MWKHRLRRPRVINSLRHLAVPFLVVAMSGCVRKTRVEPVVAPTGTPMATPMSHASATTSEPIAEPPPLERTQSAAVVHSPSSEPKAAASPPSNSPKGEQQHSERPRKRRRPKGKTYPAPAVTLQEAMLRQLEGRIDLRGDKDNQVGLPHPDARHWKRVRFLGVDHLTGFQYGENRDFVTGAFVVRTEGAPTAEKCLADFEHKAFRKLEKYSGTHSGVVESIARWRRHSLPIHRANFRVRFFFTNYEYSAVWAAYPAYPDGCLIYAMGASRSEDPNRADRVTMRFATEAFGRVQLNSKELPSRKP